MDIRGTDRFKDILTTLARVSWKETGLPEVADPLKSLPKHEYEHLAVRAEEICKTLEATERKSFFAKIGAIYGRVASKLPRAVRLDLSVEGYQVHFTFYCKGMLPIIRTHFVGTELDIEKEATFQIAMFKNAIARSGVSFQEDPISRVDDLYGLPNADR